jgi:hypothetical protein
LSCQGGRLRVKIKIVVGDAPLNTNGGKKAQKILTLHVRNITFIFMILLPGGHHGVEVTIASLK